MSVDTLKFANFDASHIERFRELLQQSTFTTVEEWTGMPDAIKPITYTFGQDTGNKYAVLRGLKDGIPVQAFIGEQHLYVSRRSSEETPYYTTRDHRNTLVELQPMYFYYIEVDLPFTVPHVRVHPQGKIPVEKLGNASSAQLEGDFNRYFTVETVEGQQVAAFEILPPNAMMRLLEVVPDLQLEFQGNKLFIKVPLPQPFFNVTTSAASFGGENVRVVKFKDDWDSFYKKLSTTLDSVPHFVDAARTASIPEEDFQLIESKWNSVDETTQGPQEIRERTKLGNALLVIVPVVVAAGIAVAAFSTFFAVGR